MNLQELNELDFSQAGIWPMPVKLVFILIASILLGIGGYYFHLEERLNNWDIMLDEHIKKKVEEEWKLRNGKSNN